MRQSDRLAIFKLIPPKVAVSVVAIAILYALLQPAINQSFGWHLPSIASILELDFSANAPANDADKPLPKHNGQGSSDSTNKQSEKSPRTSPQLSEESQSSRNTETTHQRTDERPTSNANGQKEQVSSEESPHYGVLQTVGRDRYRSPAGLVYGPGSEQGHRLKHIEQHLSDNPNRPGSHGVFEGDMKQFLVAIDDAYSRANRGAKGTSRRNEQDAVVYEANFAKPIGYLGGLEGKRKNNPELKRLRVVVSSRNDNVITAFPF